MASFHSLWVFSDSLTASESAGHSVYSVGKSSASGGFPGQTWSVSYGTGSAYGYVYTDTFCVGTLCIGGYPMETASYVDPYLTSLVGMDGIFGMDLSWYQTQGPVSENTWLSYVNYYGIGTLNASFCVLYLLLKVHKALLSFKDATWRGQERG